MGSFASPLTTLVSAWLFLFGLYYSGIIVYNDIPDGNRGILYIALFLVIFASGHRLAVEPDEGPSSASSQDGERGDAWREEIHQLRFLVSIFAACGIAAALLFSYEMIFIVHADPFDLLSVRDLYLEREATIYSQVAVVLGAGGFFSLVAVILCWEYLSPLTRVFWLVSPFLLSVFSVFSAGRQTVLQLVLIPFFAWSLKRFSGARSLHAKTVKALFMIFAFLVLGYGMFAAYQRNTFQFDISKKDMLMRIIDAQFHPGIDEKLENAPPVVRDGLSEMVVYFSHEIPNYLVFFDLPRTEIYFGMWELPFLARRLHSLGVISFSIEGKMQEEYARFERSGRFSQVWQTAIRDLILDFGLTGTLIMAGLLGFASGRVYRRFQAERSLHAAFLLVGVNLCCAYSIMLSVISDTLVFFYMLIAIIFYMRDVLRAPAATGPLQDNAGF